MKNKSASQSLLAGLFVVLVFAASNSIVRACPDTSTWIGGSDDWFDGGNWSNGCVPTSTIDATINNGGEAQIKGGSVHAVAKTLILGDDQGEEGSVTIDYDHTAVLDTGNSTCRDNIYIGNRGTGNLTLRNEGYIRSRYGFVAALQNPTQPNSSGNVLVEGSDTIWYLYDHYDPKVGCTGAGLYIGCTADSEGVGGTGTVDVSDGATIAVVNRGNAPGVTVGLGGTLTGNWIVYLTGGNATSKTVKVLGTLAPHGLNIFGNLELGSSAHTVCNVTHAVWDNVWVAQSSGGGHVALGGHVTVNMTGGNFSVNESYRLVHADAGLNNTTFDSATINYAAGPYDPCISGVITYDANNAYLTIEECQ